jgi:3-oxoacyl-[acyl-carrier-protein] synthase-3
MIASKITGLGIALPEAELTNAELATITGSSEEWIVARTGIHSRRIAAPKETTDHLGRLASFLAIEDARREPGDIDLVICATVTGERAFPSTACLIQQAFGTTVPAFDIGAGCSGFLYGLHLADNAVRSGSADSVLVVGSEVLSRITNRHDPKTGVLFGDGAGAAVVERGAAGSGFESFRLWADGSRPDLLHVDPKTGYIHMEGREVYRAAVDAMASSVDAILTENDVDAANIDLVVAHQANQRILTAVAQRLAIDPSKVYSNISRYGNTSAASIPIALYEARKEGLIKEGSLILLTAFGAGFTWGAGMLRWAPANQRDPVVATAGVLDA